MESLSGAHTVAELLTMQFLRNKNRYIAEIVYRLKHEHSSSSECSSVGNLTAVSMVLIEKNHRACCLDE